MSASKHLPAYKQAVVLVHHFYETTKKAPRELRYTLVHTLLAQSVELLVDIDAANRSEKRKRLQNIEKATEKIVRINVLLGVAYEQRCMSKGAFAMCIAEMNSLEKQVFGWLRYTEKSLTLTGQP